MKKAFKVVAMLFFLGAGVSVLFNFFLPNKFTVKIEGDKGVEFKGNYAKINSGTTVSKSFSGVVPYEIEIEANIVSISAQKIARDTKKLKVSIYKNGELQVKGDTWEDYGVVLVSTN